MSETQAPQPLKLTTLTYLDVQDIPQPYRSTIIRGFQGSNGTMHYFERNGWDRNDPEFKAARDWVWARLPSDLYEIQIKIWW